MFVISQIHGQENGSSMAKEMQFVLTCKISPIKGHAQRNMGINTFSKIRKYIEFKIIWKYNVVSKKKKLFM